MFYGLGDKLITCFYAIVLLGVVMYFTNYRPRCKKFTDIRSLEAFEPVYNQILNWANIGEVRREYSFNIIINSH